MEGKYKVYMHIAPNGKKYIGITSQRVNRRWRNGNAWSYIHNEHFSRAISKYGWENIEHITLFDGLPADRAKRLEKILICTFKANNREYGYSKTDGGEGVLGYKPSAETRRRMSEAQKGKKRKKCSEETKRRLSLAHKELCKNPEFLDAMHEANPNKKKVYQYDLAGNLIKVWVGVKKAERAFTGGKATGAIRQCCAGGCNGAHGYVWSYEPVARVPTVRCHRKVYQYTLNGELVKTWETLQDAVNLFRKDKKSIVISQCVSGHRPHAYKYHWSYDLIESEAI